MAHAIELKGKNVFISGGTSGIGLALARLFAARGANLFLFSVDKPAVVADAVKAVCASKIDEAQRIETEQLDVSDWPVVQDVIGKAIERFGAPFVLVNSAGIGGAVYFEQLSFERFDRTIKINLYGTRNTVAAVVPAMKKAGGYIVNVSSMSGLIGIIGYTAYASSKFGVVGFSASLRSEMKSYGIHVSVLCPAQVDTPLLQTTDKDKPPETKAINDRAGLMSADDVAQQVLKAMEKDKFVIVPGRRARLFYLLQRLFPTLRERLTDRTVQKVRESLRRG